MYKVVLVRDYEIETVNATSVKLGDGMALFYIDSKFVCAYSIRNIIKIEKV
jgi:hypothetical protein